MLRYFLKFIILFLFTTLSFAGNYPPVTIGVIVPIQHQALDEIVAGFKQELSKDYPGKITFVVKNAQGDINMQKSILQEFKQSKIDLIAPVATSTLQMTAAMITTKPVVGIAVEFTEQQRLQRKIRNVTAVDDEIGGVKKAIFIHEALPSVRKVTIVHSATSSKITQEVSDFTKAAKPLNIDVQDITIQQLSDLYTASSQIDKGSQAIIIFKDSLIASGINTLVKIADTKHIALISSDNATVENGAAFALGVKEFQIGVEAGKITAKILTGTDTSQIPVKKLDSLSVFVNTSALAKQKIDLAPIKAAAKKYNYPVIIMNSTGAKS